MTIYMSCVVRNLHDIFLEIFHLCEIYTSNDVLKCEPDMFQYRDMIRAVLSEKDDIPVL